MESLIKSSEFFIERAKKPMENVLKEVEGPKAKVVVVVEMTLT